MELLEQLQQDKANLAQGLERMQEDWEKLNRQILQQSGALQYVDLILKRIADEKKDEEDQRTVTTE